MLKDTLQKTRQQLRETIEGYQAELETHETGFVVSVGRGVVQVDGLHGVRSQELVEFKNGAAGIAFNLDPDTVGVVLLGHASDLKAGTEVKRTGRVVDVPVGTSLLGRTINALGEPLDGQGLIRASEHRSIERDAPAILDRAPVTRPLETGIKVIDALIPIGRGQRELILGDRQTGKTTIAVDTIINQKDTGILSIYCAIGQRASAVAHTIAALRDAEAMDHTIVVVASGEDPPGLQYITPYAATTIAEFFMEQGHDVLIVYDDLTRHARGYRELSLLLRRPPGREAYPGDIFYVHSRLLERATQLKEERGGGSLTALPIIETEAQNLSAYIPTNLISITDGQIYLSPRLYQQNILPAVDAGKSVSRVGGKTQLPAYRRVSGELRLSYSQFEELESFSRFGARLDQATQKTLERGQKVRETFKQYEHEPISFCEQIMTFIAVTEGLFDDIPLQHIGEAEGVVRWVLTDRYADVCRRIHDGETLEAEERAALLQELTQALEKYRGHA